jgi:hypothetical protein
MAKKATGVRVDPKRPKRKRGRGKGKFIKIHVGDTMAEPDKKTFHDARTSRVKLGAD